MQAHTGASDARPATPGWRGRGVRSRDRQAYSKWNISNKISRSKYSARDKLTGWVVAPFESKLRCAPGASAGGGAESGREGPAAPVPPKARRNPEFQGCVTRV